MSEDIRSIIKKAEESQDPALRLGASQYKAWAQAGNDLATAKAAVEFEKSHFESARYTLEQTIATEAAHAEPIIANEKNLIAVSQGHIEAATGRVEAARSALEAAVAEHKTRLEGLQSAVKAADGVDARLNAELMKS